MLKVKNLFIILAIAFIFNGCSRKQETPKSKAIDLIVVGQDVSWADGYVLRVAKRDGPKLQGVQITKTDPNGQVSVFSAEKGTVSKGADQKSVNIILYEVETQRGKNQFKTHRMQFALTE